MYNSLKKYMLNSNFRTLLHFTFLLVFSCVSAQSSLTSFAIDESVEFKDRKKELFEKMLLSDASGNYMLFSKGKDGSGEKSIRKFDDKFQPLDYRLTLTYDKKISNPVTIDVIVLKSKIFHIWSGRSTKGIEYFSQEIDLPSASTKTENRIAHISNEDAYYGTKKSTIIIEDTDTLNKVNLYIEIHKVQKDNKSLLVYAYDSEMKPISHENYILPQLNENFFIKSLHPYQSDKTVLFGVRHESKNLTESIENKEYSYLAYQLSDNQVTLLTEIKPKGQYLNTFLATLNENNLFISGLLADEAIDEPSGLYFSNFDLRTMKMVAEKRTSLPNSFYKYPKNNEEELRNTERRKRKDNNEDSNYLSKNLLVTDKNEVILIVEQASHIIYSGGSFNHSMGGVQPTFSPVYRHFQSLSGTENKTETFKEPGMHLRDDIAVFKFDESGNLLWSTKVEKQQQWPTYTMYITFYPIYKNDKLYLFYNGNFINIEGDGDFLGKKDSALLCTIVKDNGQVQRNIISYYTQEYPVVGIPSLSNYSNTSDVLLYYKAPENHKRHKFTRVHLK